jgi:hypothetical protein
VALSEGWSTGGGGRDRRRLSLGIISPALFTMLVLMALTTTAMTTPVLRWLGWRPAKT